MWSVLKSRPVKIAAAMLLLAALYWRCDWRAVAHALAGLHPGYIAVAFGLFIPQTMIAAWRWQGLVAPRCQISLIESTRQTLIASAWNLIVPSKLGDVSKAALLPGTARASAIGLVALEKIADVASLVAWWALGALISWPIVNLLLAGALGCVCLACDRMSDTREPGATRCIRVAASSLLLWWLHLAQIYCFLWAASVQAPLPVAMARVPAAIFAGLLPVSFCGIGTRDSALVWLFSDLATPATMAAVGLLTALRYLVPGALGIGVLSFAHRRQSLAANITKEPQSDLSRAAFHLLHSLWKLRLYSRHEMPIMHDARSLKPAPAGDD